MAPKLDLPAQAIQQHFPLQECKSLVLAKNDTGEAQGVQQQPLFLAVKKNPAPPTTWGLLLVWQFYCFCLSKASSHAGS